MAEKPSSILKSVFAALLGVQSDKQRQQDFSQGKAWQFIGLGIVMVLALVMSLVLLVTAIT
ncbi:MULTISPECIES: DUF2970 domain-containing protein [unclassified Agarivorans]|uniref:DUF2970 domain-containing protein n=1 Tax=unclassified Agarivorans TaxID=2636026 RepID=UPI003D7C72F4